MLRYTYRLCCILAFILMMDADTFAQSCRKNMLVLPDGNSYAVVSSPKNIPLTSLTVECWANPTTIQDEAGIVEFGDRSDTGAFSIRLGSGQTVIATVRMSNGIINLQSPTIPNINSWHHFALTVTPNDSIRLYINGNFVASAVTSASTIVGSWNSFYIGYSGTTGINFIGDIDELRIWSVARTQAQILASMSQPYVGNETGLTQYYKFDDDPQGNFIHNFTGTGNEASFVTNAFLDVSSSPVQGPPPNGYMLGSKEKLLLLPDLLCTSSETAVVHIFNRGDESIEIGQIGFQLGNVFSVSSTSGFPLSPGDTNRTALVNIQVNAPNPGFYTDTLIVPSTTICGGIVRIPVSVRRDIIAFAFEDTVFRLGTLLNCKLPLETQTLLRNSGTKTVTINSLSFTGGAPITILSPQGSFTINAGATQKIKLRILSGAPQIINYTLRAIAAECPKFAQIRFDGIRSTPSFSVVPSVVFPTINLPVAPIQLDTTIYFKNTGTTVLSFNPPLELLGANSFQLIKPSNGLALIKPDSSLPITIRYKVSECGIYQANLHIQDIRDCGIDTVIPLAITILGPLVSTISDTVDLGAGCNIRDTIITFHNQSGRSLLIGNPIFSEDNVLSLQSFGSLPKQLNDGDSITLKFRFDPNKPGEYTIIARFPLSPCGDKIITFHSIYGVGKITKSDSVVDFGAGCDLSSQTSTIKIRNLTGRIITPNDTVNSLPNDFRIISPALPFTMISGEEKTLRVEYTPSSFGASRGVITLTENGCYITTLPAKAVREHAKIIADRLIVEFGTICPHDTLGQSLILTNVGHRDVTITSARIIGNAAFTISGSIPQPITSGTSVSIPLMFIPNDTTEFVALIELLLGPCNDTVRFTLHGTGGPKPELLTTNSVVDFSSVTISKDSIICLTLFNPSCLTIVLSTSSFSLISAPFRYIPITLPDSVTDIHPITICFAFKPDRVGTFSAMDTITVGKHRVIVQLKGKAVQPDLHFTHIIDVGDVQQGSTKTVPFVISNAGDAATSIVVLKNPNPDFSLSTIIPLIGARPSLAVNSITFNPQTLGKQSTTFVLLWTGHTDTILLRGRGTGPGPLFSVSTVDFGNIRVGHDSIISVDVSASQGFPITITGVSVSGSAYRVSPTGTAFINSINDTIHYQIKYWPFAEQQDDNTLTLTTASSSDVTLDLHGVGVEAHLVIKPDSINFGSVALRASAASQTVTISNTGGYPLTLFSSTLHNLVFTITPDPLSQNPIAPYSSSPFTINFKPTRAISYRDSLLVSADAPEHSVGTLLVGRGVFAPLGYPEITYTLPDIRARVGDIVEVPIIIGGSDIDLIDIDSFFFDLHYDPFVVFFDDTIISKNTISDGSTLRFERLEHDSTIRISGKGKRLQSVSGILCALRAEALLSQHDSTGLTISNSNPKNSTQLQSTSGSFVVTDCGNYRGGILFKGQYSLAPATPTPTTNIITIPFELGLAARVKIDLFDQLGRHIRTLLDADRGVGKHELVSHLGDLPSGEYYYVLESLEYRSSGKLFLTK